MEREGQRAYGPQAMRISRPSVGGWSLYTLAAEISAPGWRGGQGRERTGLGNGEAARICQTGGVPPTPHIRDRGTPRTLPAPSAGRSRTRRWSSALCRGPWRSLRTVSGGSQRCRSMAVCVYGQTHLEGHGWCGWGVGVGVGMEWECVMRYPRYP